MCVDKNGIGRYKYQNNILANIIIGVMFYLF